MRATAALMACMALATDAIAAGPIHHAQASTAGAYHWHLPRGFPIPAVPADNPMSVQKVALGQRLFHEQRLSRTGSYACVNCHQAQQAFTDGRARAVGATGNETRRSAMSLANVAYNAAYTWSDPSVTTLEAQMLQPLFNRHPIEMGLAGRESQVTQWLSSDPSYRRQFAQAFAQDDAPVSIANLIKSIAAYERTLIFGRSAFDRYVFDDDRNALAPEAKRGMALFYSARVGCAQCHFGLNFSGPMRFQGHEQASAIYANTGLGTMRVPSLRNVALTAPYMHDGSMATLDEVIDYYANGGRARPSGASAGNRPVDRRIRPFQISVQEKRDLIAFLASLTDQQFTQP